MIRAASTKYAIRGLLRQSRRTLLSMVGAGVGCAMGIIAAAWVSGAGEMQMRAAAESGAGHLKVVPSGWTDSRESSLRLADWQRTVEAVRAADGVRCAAMRASANGLLAFGNRTHGTEIIGVDPEAELASNRIVYKSRITGRYLQPGDAGKVVVGKTVTKRLNVELDDDLYVTLAGPDGITSVMLTIVGVLETGSEDLDASICHVTMDNLNEAVGCEGPAEVALLLDKPAALDTIRASLQAGPAARNAVITWMEVNPDIAANVEGDTAFTRILVIIVLVVVALGIAGAQLTGVLERRREFAVLSALGMKDGQLVGVLLMEAVVIGVGGAVVGLLIGGPIAHYLATTGIDLTAMLAGETSMGGVLMDPIMRAAFGPWVVGYAFGLSLVATLAATLYPAWFATRTDPADALRSAG